MEDLKEIHVLSLDGGGSRGIMESIMLGHIMNLATIMKDNPGQFKDFDKMNPDQYTLYEGNLLYEENARAYLTMESSSDD